MRPSSSGPSSLGRLGQLDPRDEGTAILQNTSKYSPNVTASHASSPLFKLHVFSLPPAAQWSGRYLWTAVRPDGESCAEHMRYDGDPPPGDTVGLQAEKGELPCEPVSTPHYTVQGEQQAGDTVELTGDPLPGDAVA